MIEFIGRKILQKLPAELAHDLAIKSLGSPLASLIAEKQILNPVKLMGITFPNPVGLAAGFDKNGEAISGLSKQGFGFLELGTVTPKPQKGNPKPRLFRLSANQAIINRMGFNNKGIDYLVQQVKNSNFSGVLGINIGKNKDTPNQQALDDYAYCFKKAHLYADYITINISSPNTAGLRDLQGKQQLPDLLNGMKEIQANCAKKSGKYTAIVVKISPDQTDEQLQLMTNTIVDTGMDGIICSNTTVSRDNLPFNESKSKQSGWLSGRPLFDKSNKTLQKIRHIVNSDFPIIAVGGIMSDMDALKKLHLGANLIQLYTGFVIKGNVLIQQINHQIKSENTR